MAIKYDAIQRGNISEILGRLEKKGYKIVGLKMVTPTRQQIEAHYHDLKGRPFFAGLVDYMTGLPLVCIVAEGKGVISYSRVMIGATNPLVAPPGTIRGDLSVDVGRNSVHGSDSVETAKDEINLWFKPEEVANYELANAQWVYEK
ncbi:nucleoside diphosphate kinase [Naegleria gruberi]|uniref:Nucleoside diphosphate kinase n=1 Tax=Naegleria gruberi TaxID=5762 RepID=D2VCE5_NAEGR|nr:nucleoside diphosphate kinase [Naegleria gruberi]EFC45407.1 nucleoside diphosphate kinase [Naegleria gruberi]|eukprot:XP_002678151.1 nucleoside diphosphate kinase [Naegleria gruberi strain NEG-M]